MTNSVSIHEAKYRFARAMRGARGRIGGQGLIKGGLGADLARFPDEKSFALLTVES